MKNIICLLITVVLIFSFCSCTPKGDNGSTLQDDEFEKVEITLDNYQEYFELKEHFYAYKDEFGDYVDSMVYGVYLSLKEEYEAQTEYDKSDLKVKFQMTTSLYGLDFNEESGEGKRLGLIDAYDNVYTVTENFYDLSNQEGYEKLTYAAKIHYNSVAVWPYDEGGFDDKYKYSVDCPENIKITGIMGNLYVRKK